MGTITPELAKKYLSNDPKCWRAFWAELERDGIHVSESVLRQSLEVLELKGCIRVFMAFDRRGYRVLHIALCEGGYS